MLLRVSCRIPPYIHAWDSPSGLISGPHCFLLCLIQLFGAAPLHVKLHAFFLFLFPFFLRFLSHLHVYALNAYSNVPLACISESKARPSQHNSLQSSYFSMSPTYITSQRASRAFIATPGKPGGWPKMNVCVWIWYCCTFFFVFYKVNCYLPFVFRNRNMCFYLDKFNELFNRVKEEHVFLMETVSKDVASLASFWFVWNCLIKVFNVVLWFGCVLWQLVLYYVKIVSKQQYCPLSQ